VRKNFYGFGGFPSRRGSLGRPVFSSFSPIVEVISMARRSAKMKTEEDIIAAEATEDRN